MKIIKAALLLSAIALSIPTPAKAEWIQINENPNEHPLYVDNETITQIDSDNVGFWEKSDFHQAKGMTVNAITRNVVNCNQRLWAIEQYVINDLSGEVVASHTFEELKFKRVVPGSAAEDSYNFVCRR